MLDIRPTRLADASHIKSVAPGKVLYFVRSKTSRGLARSLFQARALLAAPVTLLQSFDDRCKDE